MAKTNIILNNKTYSIDEATLASAIAELRTHLSTTMSGEGATINFGGTTYNIDSTKLTAATNDFVSHLSTISGSGSKVKVGGVEIPVDSTKLSSFISDMSNALNDLVSGGGSVLEAGLYVDGVMTTSWDELESGGVVHVVGYEDLPEKSEYGFYYGMKYSIAIEGTTIGFTFNKDGSVAFDQAGNPVEIPAESVIYGDHTIDMSAENMPVFEVSADGMAISGDGVTLSLGSSFPAKGTVYVVTIGAEAPMLVGDLVLPDDGRITSIGSFKEQSSLSSITLPDSVTTINKNAFSGCSSLSEIIFNGTIAQWNEITLGTYWNKNVPATHVQCSDGNVIPEGPTLGFPITWNSMEVMGNTSFVFQEMPFIKVSEFTPTAEDFVGTEMSAMGEVISCDMAQDMGGFAVAMYGEQIYIFSVVTPGEYADLDVAFPEAGFYVLDFGSMGTDADFTITPPIPTLATPEISLENKILTITPVENASEYKVYVDSELICTTTETSIDLTEKLLQLEKACNVSVCAICASGEYKNSELSTIEYSLPILATPEISLSNGILTITQVDNATGYEVYVDNELICTTNESTVDLSGNVNDDSSCIKVRAVALPGSYFPSSYEYILFSGLYNSKNERLASWNKLVNEYGLNITANYGNNSSAENYYKTNNSSMYYILTQYSDLSGGSKLILDNDLTSIGNFVFCGCSSLKSVVIGDNVTSIGEGAFSGCSNITNVVIGDSVTTIGISAFSNCSSLKSVVIPDSVTSIGSFAFSSCSSLKSVVIPNGVASINTYTFRGCSNLTSITIPDSVTSIDRNAFDGCKSLTSVVIPDNVTTIGWRAFYQCSSLNNVVIGDSVTSIDSEAFSSCSSLKSVVIGDSVASISGQAFLNCRSLTSITIPNSVTSIGSYAFDRCESLTSVYITDLASWCNIEFGYDRANPLYYAKNLYLNDELVTDLVIPDGATSIGNYAFLNCTSLTSISIPDSITSIGTAAFNGCSSLTSVYITDLASWCNIEFGNGPANPLYYTENLYLNNELVTELVIPDSVTSIGEYAFYQCSSLESVAIPNSVISIDSEAFSSCSNLKSVVIGDSVASIGKEAFNGCSSLTSVVIGDSVTSIGNYAFDDCSSLTNITFEGTTTQWSTITLGTNWNTSVPATYIQCSDGQVAL